MNPEKRRGHAGEALELRDGSAPRRHARLSGQYRLRKNWTLSPTSTGTHLRMEQSGFRSDQQQAYRGAKGGWQGFFAGLEQVLARIDWSSSEQVRAGLPGVKA
ncbi:MAG: SRPBCC family protein [Caulobacteraceae bacterium]